MALEVSRGRCESPRNASSPPRPPRSPREHAVLDRTSSGSDSLGSLTPTMVPLGVSGRSEGDQREIRWQPEIDLTHALELTRRHKPVLLQCIHVAEIPIEPAACVDAARPRKTVH